MRHNQADGRDMSSSLRPFLRCSMRELVGLYNDVGRCLHAVDSEADNPVDCPLGEHEDLEEIGLIELGSRILEAAKDLRERVVHLEHLLAGPLDKTREETLPRGKMETHP